MIDMFISKCSFAKVSLKLAAGNGVPAAQVRLGPGRQPGESLQYLWEVPPQLPLLFEKLSRGMWNVSPSEDSESLFSD